MMLERRLNAKMRERKRGEHVFYGQEICLMHSESGMYIQAMPKSTFFDNKAFVVTVSDELSKNMTFIAQPFQAYR